MELPAFSKLRSNPQIHCSVKVAIDCFQSNAFLKRHQVPVSIYLGQYVQFVEMSAFTVVLHFAVYHRPWSYSHHLIIMICNIASVAVKWSSHRYSLKKQLVDVSERNIKLLRSYQKNNKTRLERQPSAEYYIKILGFLI